MTRGGFIPIFKHLFHSIPCMKCSCLSRKNLIGLLDFLPRSCHRISACSSELISLFGRRFSQVLIPKGSRHRYRSSIAQSQTATGRYFYRALTELVPQLHRVLATSRARYSLNLLAAAKKPEPKTWKYNSETRVFETGCFGTTRHFPCSRDLSCRTMVLRQWCSLTGV